MAVHAVPVDAEDGGVVSESAARCVQDATGEFLNDLSGVTVPGGSEGDADVYFGGVAFEVAVGDEQKPVAGLQCRIWVW